MTLFEYFNSLTSLPYHGIIPFGNFTGSYRKCFPEFLGIRAKRRFEEQRIIKFVTYSAFKCHEYLIAQMQPRKHLLVPEYFCAITALVSPVEEPAFGNTVVFF